MKRIGVIIDDYKLEAFKKGLTGKFTHKVCMGLVPNTKEIRIRCDDDQVNELKTLIAKINKEASN